MRRLGSRNSPPQMKRYRKLKDNLQCLYPYNRMTHGSLWQWFEDLFREKLKKNIRANKYTISRDPSFIARLLECLYLTRNLIIYVIMTPTKSSHQQSLSSRIHMAFQGSLLKCFEELDEIFLSYQAKDLVYALPQILETLFNYDGSCPNEMNFGRLTSSQAYDFQATLYFFGLESPLISLVAKLTADPTCFTLYEFPFGHLPPATQNSILTGRTPAFYASKIKYGTSGKVPESVMLDAFDLYMFHFAYYVVNQHNWKILHIIGDFTNRSQWIYFSLLDGYLKAFFPTSNQLPVRVTKLHSRLQSHPPNFDGASFCQASQIGVASSPVRASFSPKMGQGPRVSRLLNLDPQLMLQLDGSRMDSTSAVEASVTANTGLQADLFSCSDTVLQIFVDFWLNQFDSSVLEQQVWLTNKMLKVQDFFYVIRILVKHLHHFVNSSYTDDPWGTAPATCTPPSTAYISPSFSSAFIKNITPIQQQRIQQQQQVKQQRSIFTQEQREWDEFKRGIWSHWLSSKLYNFLKYHFMYGPIERTLIETWLSFIQPWRYTSNSLQPDGEKFIDQKWMPFMRKHLLFYTTFLQLVMERFLFLDFTSAGNSILLSRVTKVFSNKCLREVLQEVESSMNTSNDRLNLSGIYMYPCRVEGDNYHYTSLFSEDAKTQAIRLITNIMVAREELENQLMVTRNQATTHSWLQRMFAFLDPNDESSFVPNTRKNIEQLESSINQFMIFFEISSSELPRIPASICSRRPVKGSPGLRRCNYSEKEMNEDLPDMEINKDGNYVLTPLGRHEILMKRKKVDVEYMGDPDLQPIRSFEYGPLVRLLYKFCRDINKKYSKDIQRATEQPGLSGKFARYLFCGREHGVPKRMLESARSTPQRVFTSPRGTDESPNQPKLVLSPGGVLTNRRKLPPRLSLRFLATYYNIAIILLLLLIIKISFGLDLLSMFIMFGLVMFGLLYLMMKILHSCHETSELEDAPVRRVLSFQDDQ